MIGTGLSSYDHVAPEYYDPVRHPTCANFFELSAAFLVPRIHRYASAAKAILEVGAGRSIVAPTVAAQGLPLSRVTLLDHSERMLEHSRNWARRGATLLVAEAASTGLPSASIQLIVSSLGDPYNDASFWQETRRLLDPGGVCLFTTPAPEWADRFRAGSDRKLAEFVLANGNKALVRSDIPSVTSQIRLIAEAGLDVDETQALYAAQLSGELSAKLLVDGRVSSSPVVRGFTVRKKKS